MCVRVCVCACVCVCVCDAIMVLGGSASVVVYDLTKDSIFVKPKLEFIYCTFSKIQLSKQPIQLTWNTNTTSLPHT